MRRSGKATDAHATVGRVVDQRPVDGLASESVSGKPRNIRDSLILSVKGNKMLKSGQPDGDQHHPLSVIDFNRTRLSSKLRKT